jgi:hypothetical protein
LRVERARKPKKAGIGEEMGDEEREDVERESGGMDEGKSDRKKGAKKAQLGRHRVEGRESEEAKKQGLGRKRVIVSAKTLNGRRSSD